MVYRAFAIIPLDLRERTVAALGQGTSSDGAADRFGISLSSAGHCVGRVWRECPVAPRARGGDQRWQAIAAHAAEQRRPDVKAARENGFEDQDALDEIGANTRMGRCYGPGRRGALPDCRAYMNGHSSKVINSCLIAPIREKPIDAMV